MPRRSVTFLGRSKLLECRDTDTYASRIRMFPPGLVLFRSLSPPRSALAPPDSCNVMGMASIIGPYVVGVALFFLSSLRDIQWRKGAVRMRMNAVTRVGCVACRARKNGAWRGHRDLCGETWECLRRESGRCRFLPRNG